MFKKLWQAWLSDTTRLRLRSRQIIARVVAMGGGGRGCKADKGKGKGTGGRGKSKGTSKSKGKTGEITPPKRVSIAEADGPPQKKKKDNESQGGGSGDDVNNAAYLATIMKAYNKIIEDMKMKSLLGAQALHAGANAEPEGDWSQALTGFSAPASNAAIVGAMAKDGSGEVRGGGNLLWLDPAFLANPGVPISLNKVKSLMQYHHGSPSAPCLEITVALPAGIDAQELKNKLCLREVYNMQRGRISFS